MEPVTQLEAVHVVPISTDLFNKLNRLGLIPNDVRSGHVGKSDYSKHIIQPWSIWIDYELDPWDADIVKRVLRTKEEPGMSTVEARIMDYDKIEHICREKKRQLSFKPSTCIVPSTVTNKEYVTTVGSPVKFDFSSPDLNNYTTVITS